MTFRAFYGKIRLEANAGASRAEPEDQAEGFDMTHFPPEIISSEYPKSSSRGYCGHSEPGYALLNKSQKTAYAHKVCYAVFLNLRDL